MRFDPATPTAATTLSTFQKHSSNHNASKEPDQYSPSTFHFLPDDVVREIFLACMDPDTIPTTSSAKEVPRILSQISHGARRVALSTTEMWASLRIDLSAVIWGMSDADAISCMMHHVEWIEEWLRRSGQRPLTISLRHHHKLYAEPFERLLDILLRCCSRWSDISLEGHSIPLSRVAALTQADVPLLSSLSLHCDVQNSVIRTSKLLDTPSLNTFKLYSGTADAHRYAVDWANITHLELGGTLWDSPAPIKAVLPILQQTSRLAVCIIHLGSAREARDLSDISLPYLRVLKLSSAVPWILKAIDAPALEELWLSYNTNASGVSSLLKRSPGIKAITVVCERITTGIVMEWLRSCPALTSLQIQRLLGSRTAPCDGNVFLDSFALEDETLRLCPQLQVFQYAFDLDVSMETLSRFLRRTRGNTSECHGWKDVEMGVRLTGNAAGLRSLVDPGANVKLSVLNA